MRELLSVTEQSDADEWQEYLVDGLDVNCSDDELIKFCENSRLPNKVCNMCTAKPLHFSAAIQENGKRKIIVS